MTNVLGTSAIAGHSETPPAYLNTAEQNGDIRPLEVGHRGDGFPRNRNFFIRKKGTELYLLNDWFSHTEGALLHLWPLQAVHDIGRKNQLFYIDETGALCHSMSGLAVDVLDDIPILRRRHLVPAHPNPWSHPLPIFTYEKSQIRVHFLSDPAMPICTEEIYPNQAWRSDNLVLATKSKKPFHRHKMSDFAPWVPLNMMETMSWARLDRGTAAESEPWKVNVKERLEDTDGDRGQALWDIIPTSNSTTDVNLC